MVAFIVNGWPVEIDGQDDKPLLWVLHEDLGILGPKYGCGIAQCGACRVPIDGESTPSRITCPGDAEGATVVAVEGLTGPDGTLSAVQQAWLDEQVPQCGFCQRGFLIAATALPAVNPPPAHATWTNALQVRPEEAAGPVVRLARRAPGQIGMIATGVSGSTMGLWHPMRIAGASARQMLMAAGAARLGVPLSELARGDGFVRQTASGRSLSCCDLARDAAVLPPPRDPVLKPAAEWRLIGRPQARVDLTAKIRGGPVFGIDMVLPEMLHATIRHAPVFGSHAARVVNEADMRAEPMLDRPDAGQKRTRP